MKNPYIVESNDVTLGNRSLIFKGNSSYGVLVWPIVYLVQPTPQFQCTDKCRERIPLSCGQALPERTSTQQIRK